MSTVEELQEQLVELKETVQEQAYTLESLATEFQVWDNLVLTRLDELEKELHSTTHIHADQIKELAVKWRETGRGDK